MANQIHGFTIDYGKFIIITVVKQITVDKYIQCVETRVGVFKARLS